MNYLAHLRLADGSPDSITGNFLGDFVKGQPESDYPAPICRGIRLHRRLDAFTDAHPAVARAVGRLPRSQRRVAWIAVDMAFDHFLARWWARTDAAGFAAFRRHVYAVLAARAEGMPAPAARVARRMGDDDWLGSYAEFDGIRLALRNMGRRLSRPTPLADCIDGIGAHYTALAGDFDAFWPDVRERAAREILRLACLHPDP